LIEKTARVRVGSEPTTHLSRLAVVFADPVRLKIVSELFLREMSPSEFFEAHGGGTLSRVDAHFKRLARFGWLRLVRKESGGGRRGATENFYRAPQLAIFDTETWAELPRSLRAEFSWRIFEQFAERVKIALEAGTFDRRPERHFTWTPLVLDEEGRGRVIKLVDDLFAALFEEQADARTRLCRSGEPPIYATVALAAFDSPKLHRNRSGLLLPAPPSEAEPIEEPYTVRLARIFSNEVNLKIITELSLRQMSASQFVEEVGGGEVPEISRRFRVLAQQGWIVKVEEKTGGRRRGGVESFYRATKPAIFDTRSWSKVPNRVRMTYSWRIFEQLAEQVREAVDADTFDSRVDRHHTWTPFVLDRVGWSQVIAAVDAAFYAVLEEQRRAKQRLDRRQGNPVIATVYLAAFESPAPSGGSGAAKR
jgi:DNA-binding transcriptional ArsR family regulator